MSRNSKWLVLRPRLDVENHLGHPPGALKRWDVGIDAGDYLTFSDLYQGQFVQCDCLDLDLALDHVSVDPGHLCDYPSVRYGEFGLTQPLTLRRTAIEDFLEPSNQPAF